MGHEEIYVFNLKITFYHHFYISFYFSLSAPWLSVRAVTIPPKNGTVFFQRHFHGTSVNQLGKAPRKPVNQHPGLCPPFIIPSFLSMMRLYLFRKTGSLCECLKKYIFLAFQKLQEHVSLLVYKNTFLYAYFDQWVHEYI